MSDEIVVDASAVVAALIRNDAVGADIATRIIRSTCHAPHLIDAEVGSVLRRAARSGEITADEGATGLRMAKILVNERYVHHGVLASNCWALRHTITFYDGLYAALAAQLDLPLLTSDARLAKAPGLPCQVELVA